MNTDFGKIALEVLTSQDIGFVRAIHREDIREAWVDNADASMELSSDCQTVVRYCYYEERVTKEDYLAFQGRNWLQEGWQGSLYRQIKEKVREQTG